METNKLVHIDLVKRIKHGDQEAFELLFKSYCNQLTLFARVYVKYTDVAEEIIQETFIKTWEIRSSLDENLSIKAFLYKCVHNNCINHIKKVHITKKNDEKYIADLSYSLSIIEQEIPQNYFDIIASEDLEVKIEQAIEALPEQCRKVFILCRLEGLTYQQISEKLDISINTIKTQLARALQKIRAELKYFK